MGLAQVMLALWCPTTHNWVPSSQLRPCPADTLLPTGMTSSRRRSLQGTPARPSPCCPATTRTTTPPTASVSAQACLCVRVCACECTQWCWLASSQHQALLFVLLTLMRCVLPLLLTHHC